MTYRLVKMRPFFNFLALFAFAAVFVAKPAAAQYPPISAAPNQGSGMVQSPVADVLTAQMTNPPLPPGYLSEDLTVPQCAVPPKMDGTLNDSCWKTAAHVVGFYPYAVLTPIAAKNQMEAWVCADSTHLYVAFHCKQTSRIVATQTQRNGDLSKDDFVGFDVDSQFRHRSFSTFLVNAAGVQQSFIEGGTATNITWAGDWKAASMRTPDGYTAEISVPFALLRYPKGNHTFGILFYRQISGQPGLQSWPYTPLNDTSGSVEGQFMASLKGLSLPYFAPRPTFLPYTLATAGASVGNRTGLDIKYPFSTTLTGVASLYPDLDTVEQNIESISFSYDQKLLTDNRPFFAEGSSYLPDNDLFYSRSIGQFDQGLKVEGKNGDTSIGTLATNYTSASSQFEDAFNIRQDFGPFENVGVEYVADNQTGLASNQVGRIYASHTWAAPHDQYTVSVFHTQSYDGGLKEGGNDSYSFQNNQGNLNTPYYSLQYVDIAPNFDSNLGYVPEVDKRGSSLVYGETLVSSKGPISITNYELDADQFQYHSGGFFHDDASFTYYMQTKSGLSWAVIPEIDQRNDYHDHNIVLQFQYGKNTLYQQGSVQETSGQDEGEKYNFLTLNQGLFVSRRFSSQISYANEDLGSTDTSQAILNGTYRLTADRTVGFRLVSQDGTNIFVSFSQLVRSGMDVFVLFGDPNAQSTIGKLTVKLAYPF